MILNQEINKEIKWRWQVYKCAWSRLSSEGDGDVSQTPGTTLQLVNTSRGRLFGLGTWIWQNGEKEEWCFLIVRGRLFSFSPQNNHMGEDLCSTPAAGHKAGTQDRRFSPKLAAKGQSQPRDSADSQVCKPGNIKATHNCTQPQPRQGRRRTLGAEAAQVPRRGWPKSTPRLWDTAGAQEAK